MPVVKFHKGHGWARMDGDIAVIGVTDYAQKELGKIIYIGLPQEEDEIRTGEPYGEIESRKTLSELIAPLSGVVVEVNMALEDDPSAINDSPYNIGWIVRLRPDSAEEFDTLMDETAYLESVGKK